MTAQRLKIFSLVLIALLFAAYVWPTQWTYYDSGSTNYRTERFTDKTEVLTPNGWVPTGSPPSSAADGSVVVPQDQMSKITVDNASCSWSGSEMEISVYNGTNYSLNSVKIPITLYNGDGSTAWTRNYDFDSGFGVVGPSTSANLQDYGMPTIPTGDNWRIGNPLSASVK